MSTDPHPARARRVLARAVRLDGLSAEQGVWPDASWLALMAAARLERVVPAMARAVRAGVIHATPDQATDVATAWLDVMKHCLHIEARLVWLVDALTDLGIEVRVLKGPASAHLDHVRPEHRQFGDLDILVKGEDQPQVLALLAEEGFARRFPEPRPGFDRRFTKSVSVRGDIEIDVHRTLCDGPIGTRIPPDDLWRRTRPFRVGGRDLDALGDVERFLHACLHAHLGPPPPRLLTLSDVARGISSGRLDPDDVFDLADRWRVRTAVTETVVATVAELWWPDEVVSAWARPSSVGLVDAVLWASHRQRGARSAVRSMLSVGVQPGIADRARLLGSLAFPDRSYLDGRRMGWSQRLRRAWRQLQRPAGGRFDG